MKYVLSTGRMLGLTLALAYYLGRLLVLNAVFGRSKERGFAFRRKYTAASLKILGVKVRCSGSPSGEPALYVSNHRSLLDPFIQLHRIDAFIVSKAEVSSYPLVGVGARATGVVYVERRDGQSREAAKRSIMDLLISGNSVLIYPEGTTSNESTTQPFRLGSFKVATDAGVPVVPVAVDYRDPSHFWGSGGTFKFFLAKFSKRTIDAALFIGDPILSDDPEYLLGQSQAWIDEKILQSRASWA